MAAIDFVSRYQQEPAEDRKTRLARYAMRDQAIESILSAYLAPLLLREPTFRALYERALTETNVQVIVGLFFSEREEWMFRRALHDRQKVLGLGRPDTLTLEDALEQLMPKLRRDKLREVARMRAIADERASKRRLQSKPAPPDTGV